MPTATTQALSPTTPAPMIVTLPRLTPDTPGSRIPLPPEIISSDFAPAWIESRPAHSDMCLDVLRSRLDGEPSRYFRHRDQQRESSVGELDGFVAERDDLTARELL